MTKKKAETEAAEAETEAAEAETEAAEAETEAAEAETEAAEAETEAAEEAGPVERSTFASRAAARAKVVEDGTAK